MGKPCTRNLVLGIPALLCLACVLSLASPAPAQRPEVTNFTRDNGLPSASVFDLAQHPSGRLWILNRSGLTLYDGRTFKPAPREGLSTDELAALEIEESGQVWVVTRWIGPYVFRLEGAAWQKLPVPPGGDSRPKVNDLAARTDEGRPRLAVGMERSGIRVWDGSSWSVWTTAQGLSSDSVRALAVWKDGFAAGTRSGLCHLAGEDLDCRFGDRDPRLAEPILALVRVVAPGEPERLWILSDRWLGYLEDARLTVVAEGFPSLTFSLEGPGSLAVDRVGGVYFGKPERAYFFDAETRRVTALGRREGLLDDGVTALVADRESNVWVGGARGLSRIGDRRFLSFGREQGLFEDEVSAIVEAAPGRFVLGHNGALTFFDGEQGTGILSFQPPQLSPPSTHRVLDMAVDSDGVVWIAATQMGLLRLAEDRSWSQEKDPQGRSLVESAFSVEIDARGRLWVAGAGQIYVRGEDGFSAVEHGQDVGFLRWLTAASDGRIYGSTSQGVLYQEGGEWRLAEGPTEPSNNVFDVYTGPSGTVWAGTRAGLFELSDGRLTPVPEGGPEIGDPIYSIFEDPRGQVWFGTDDGVLVWDGENLRRLGFRHGLAGRETNRGGALVDHRGRVWIGTDSGLSLYQPSYDLPRSAPPAVEIAAVDVNGRRRPFEGRLELSHREKNLSFHLTKIALSRQDDILIRYQLEPFDKGWQGPAPFASMEIRYTNVPPGDYHFCVAVGWTEGPWSPEAGLEITILRPFWQTPWFYALTLLGVGLVVVGGHTLRTRAIRASYAELESVNTELERYVAERQELIAELEARNTELERFTYTVSHDLKSPLVTIMGFLGHLKQDAEKGDTERIRGDIGFIEDAASQMASLLEELLELSRIGRVMNRPEEVSMNDLAREAAKLAEGQVRASGAVVEIAPDLPAVVGDRVRLLEVVQNLIENAAKYMGDQPAPRIEVGVRSDGNPPVFFVRDNGMGIDPKYQEKIFGLFERLDTSTEGTGVGLALAKRIVEVHGGRVWVESEGGGRGSVFCFTLP